MIRSVEMMSSGNLVVEFFIGFLRVFLILVNRRYFYCRFWFVFFNGLVFVDEVVIFRWVIFFKFIFVL